MYKPVVVPRRKVKRVVYLELRAGRRRMWSANQSKCCTTRAIP
jgi:hypothetical protein